VISENHIELKFTASIELQEKIERLKGLLAHQDPNISLGELFEKLCDLGLEQWNPGKPTKTEAKAEMSATSRKTAMQRFAAPRKRRVRPDSNQTQRREHETESKMDLEPELEVEPRLESKSEPQPKMTSGLKLELGLQSMSELVPKMRSELEPKLESMSELVPKMRSELKSESESKSAPQLTQEPKLKSKLESMSELVLKMRSGLEPESRLELEPGPTPKSTLKPKSKGSEASLQRGGKSHDEGVSRGKPSNPKRLSAEIVRTVWRRAESRCENCGSSFALEIDHKIPRAKGGSSKTENLRLACRSCNQRAAIEAFGQLAMDPYINRTQ
jgi:5-methylcytosine-specific restriction endonuclease McrA